MKNLIYCLLALLVTSTSNADNIGPIPNEVTLTHRNLNPDQCQNSSCYFDLYHMKQEYGFGLSLAFGNDHGTNMINGVQVVDQVARIVDAGKISCKDIPNKYEGRGDGYPTKMSRAEEPMFWLTYSEAWDELQRGAGAPDLAAKEGHCYLMYKTNRNKRIIVAFHVKKLEKNMSMTLDEIEVFERSEIKNVK